MRVLAFVAVVVAGCYSYDPTYRDCQLTCPGNTACPDGMTCSAGVCRVANAPASCPCPEPPPGCVRVAAVTLGCLATCASSTDWEVARQHCSDTAPWQLAVLDSDETLHAAETSLGTTAYWIGLHRATGAITPWSWISGPGTVSATSGEWAGGLNTGTSATNLCAMVSSGKLSSEACGSASYSACSTN